MNIEYTYFVTAILDVLSILILIVVYLLHRKNHEEKNEGTRLFLSMGIHLFLGSLFEIINTVVPIILRDRLPYIVIMIGHTVVEICTLSFLLGLLLYTDFRLYGSKDHLNRHFQLYLIPMLLIMLLYIFNLFTGIVFSVDPSLQWAPSSIYYIVEAVEFAFIIITPIHFLKCYLKTETKRIYRPYLIFVPVVLGAILSLVLPFSVLFFGFTIGFAGFVLSGMSQWHYEDIKTHFFNRDYLRDIAEQIKEKKVSRGSMIVFDVAGDQDAFVNILKQELPTNREVISAGGGRFIFLSDKESRPKLRAATMLIQDASDDYDENHPEKEIQLKSKFKVFKDEKEMAAELEKML